jgi:hypothetical protein
MKYLRFVFPVVLVVLLGYLYSCSLDNPTKPGSTVSQVDAAGQPHGECPDLSGYTMSHMCLNFKNLHGDMVTTYVTDATVADTGRDGNGNVVYTCNYFQQGHSNGWGFGSRLPIGLTITRTALVYVNDLPWAGTQTFVMPDTEADDFVESDYYMTLDTKWN